jgi:hypothetical protein
MVTLCWPPGSPAKAGPAKKTSPRRSERAARTTCTLGIEDGKTVPFTFRID